MSEIEIENEIVDIVNEIPDNNMVMTDDNESEENNGLITNREIIDIFSKKIEKNPNFCIYGYKFDDMILDIRFNYNHVRKQYHVETYSDPYEYFDAKSDRYDNTYLDNDFYLFNSIEDSIKFLLCDMRKKYVYSKIFDTITLKENIEGEERYMIADSILCDNPRLDKCCVCYEPNKLYTKCEHNLCRVCYYKNENNLCPICRKDISSRYTND